MTSIKKISINNTLLSSYITKRIKEATVILCFRILLQDIIENGRESSMTKSQIEKQFNKKHYLYGISRFRTDYVLRQAGFDHNAIDQKNDNFFIKPSFLQGLSKKDLTQIALYIDAYWNQISIEQKQLLDEIESHLLDNGNTEGNIEFIKEMLLTRETRKKGQCFEVTSFSILKIYLRNLGFELNRFSTTYSNDGGIDFAAQLAVYQVTTKLDDKKFEEDLNKVPLKERVMVFKETTGTFDHNKLKHELVLDYISIEELLNFLEYMVRKNAERNIRDILEVMLHEFQREYYQSELF
ncbi:hypothetical protein SAMN05660649_05035 [Desulfotomaculum arcticum]|uniref:Restriction endonuclease n=1 Tax=Desulfotruncus arcticus DSM 17038 TaxID=1121424 RepID=A0A1I2ZNA7_9FIRM|nr:hypothetical protein [Desulfotruncus arcticus]SFH39317.1 hypothetical protein SAMN05660649_05035 [Desulfotomaculum arcticum] [Desulfotruncus arcticus DSM 17038]